MRNTVTLNLGLLNNPWHDLSGREIAQRVARWLAQWPELDAVDNSSVDVIRVTQYDAPQITEPTAVIQWTAHDFERDSIEEALTALARITNQDCIAWRVDFNEGDEQSACGLVGPRTADYGGVFNPDYFEDGEALRKHGWDWALYRAPVEA